MTGVEEHNNWKVMAMRRTIETRFSELCRLFDIEYTLARGIAGLQLRIDKIILAHNLRYLKLTSTTDRIENELTNSIHSINYPIADKLT